MKINVGDYVRTKTGHIGKVIDFRNDPTDYYFNCYETNITETGFIDKFVTEYSDIKSNLSIIDLIEVGDIVINQLGEIIRITSGNIDELKDYWKICENPIKSIVTKEQFEEMQYIVKED